jgi:hypothetical protein
MLNIPVVIAWWELPTIITISSIAWIVWLEFYASNVILSKFTDSLVLFAMLGWVNTAIWILYASFN